MWLYNLQGLLKTVDLCIDDLADKESALSLYAFCIDRYAEAVAQCRGRLEGALPDERGKYQTLLRGLEADRGLLFANIRKVYLPLVAKRVLPTDRYGHWRKVLEGKMAACRGEGSN